MNIRAIDFTLSITAAIGGISRALGALVEGWLAQFAGGGMTGLFALSSLLRLVGLLPLLGVKEPQQRSLKHILQQCFQA